MSTLNQAIEAFDRAHCVPRGMQFSYKKSYDLIPRYAVGTRQEVVNGRKTKFLVLVEFGDDSEFASITTLKKREILPNEIITTSDGHRMQLREGRLEFF